MTMHLPLVTLLLQSQFGQKTNTCIISSNCFSDLFPWAASMLTETDISLKGPSFVPLSGILISVTTFLKGLLENVSSNATRQGSDNIIIKYTKSKGRYFDGYHIHYMLVRIQAYTFHISFLLVASSSIFSVNTLLLQSHSFLCYREKCVWNQ